MTAWSACTLRLLQPVHHFASPEDLSVRPVLDGDQMLFRGAPKQQSIIITIQHVPADRVGGSETSKQVKRAHIVGGKRSRIAVIVKLQPACHPESLLTPVHTAPGRHRDGSGPIFQQRDYPPKRLVDCPCRDRIPVP